MLTITLAGLACSALFHHALALHHAVYLFNTFLFEENLRYRDFTAVLRAAADLDPDLGNNNAQSPLLALLGYLLSPLTRPTKSLILFVKDKKYQALHCPVGCYVAIHLAASVPFKGGAASNPLIGADRCVIAAGSV
jgi:hypothetical protein